MLDATHKILENRYIICTRDLLPLGKAGKVHDVQRPANNANRRDPLVRPAAEEPSAVCRALWKRARRGLTQLFQAYRYSCDLDLSVWEFAIRIDELQTAGLLSSDFRWLICKGFVEHASEIAPANDDLRSFRRGPRLRFGRTSCFVLTIAGVEFVTSMLQRARRDQRRRRRPPHCVVQGNGHSKRRSLPIPAAMPKWDRDRQELRLGDVVIKQFKVPAVNQERILAAFEEEGWPVRVDDPLPPVMDQDPKARLHDTIVSLNRNQKRPLIRFYGDGSGQGVRWGTVVAVDAPVATAASDGERSLTAT